MNLRRRFVEISHGQVHVAEAGDASLPAVLLLHQSPRSWREYRDVIPLLAPVRHVVAMDTLGFGDSCPPHGPDTIETWAAAAAEMMEAMGVESADVVGHHTGGVVAVELAAAHAGMVRRVVLSSTPFTHAEFRRARAERPPIDAVEPSADGTHLAALWQRRQGFYPPGRPDLLTAFVADALKVADPEAGHRAVAAYRMEDRIHLVDQPVLVIRATDDPFAAPHAEELAAALADATVVDIGGGMVPLPDQLPAEFAAAVLAFLEPAP